MWLEILVTKLATNFQDLVAKVKNLVALAPVLGAILHPELYYLIVECEFFFNLMYPFKYYQNDFATEVLIAVKRVNTRNASSSYMIN